MSEADEIRLVWELLVGVPEQGGLGITPGEGEWKRVKSVVAVHDDVVSPEASVGERSEHENRVGGWMLRERSEHLLPERERRQLSPASEARNHCLSGEKRVGFREV